MRRFASLSVLALAAALVAPAAFAQSTPAGAPAQDPVVATVNGSPIHLSDMQAAVQNLPPEAQQLPPDQLFQAVLNQLIDGKALLVAAHKEGLQNNPAVQQAMQDAANFRLEKAYVQEQEASAVTDTAVQAEYDRDYANKPGPQQVEARHILVQTQAQAESIIKQLNKGADFATLAKKYSIDPGAANGGELGWFSQDEMVPAFANAAFALQPGHYTETPVHTQFGWHVILCEGKRTAPTPKLADVADQIKQKLANAAGEKAIDDARALATVVVYDKNGKPVQPAAAPAAGN
ncbi:peptidylprolyl isomerase [Acidocella sp.]|uniref:peptidylprolyl isomerase n=1 Tax=Acidocella sp. TaxID=50710 RepID=UPI00262392D7|nr:peptidylprolyl isomerase [Acidocella sp.]